MDNTTLPRFERFFDKEREIRDGYHECLDLTLQMTKELIDKIEDSVKSWLDNNGVESREVTYKITSNNNERKNSIDFQRYEMLLKTCSNNWHIFHIAYSSRWSHLISSKPKLMVQSDPKHQPKNEVIWTSEPQEKFAQKIFDKAPKLIQTIQL